MYSHQACLKVWCISLACWDLFHHLILSFCFFINPVQSASFTDVTRVSPGSLSKSLMNVPNRTGSRMKLEYSPAKLIIRLTPSTCRCSARNPSSQQPMIFPLCNITYQQKTLQRTFDFSKKFRKWPFCFTHIPWDQPGQKCIKTELSHIWRVKRPTVLVPMTVSSRRILYQVHLLPELTLHHEPTLFLLPFK